jgi:hypothetical protein
MKRTAFTPKTEDLTRSGWKAQLTERDAHLDRPAVITHDHG